MEMGPARHHYLPCCCPRRTSKAMDTTRQSSKCSGFWCID
ncbi:unnamed protein product [Spirodela intermedia]|uniref:Uncharacterized protein n=1 Tax=Spirodela intermedia TaxID=51605 RepID=A0A7I8IB93_SPIIN|nr:unnamed protein product [Spirodela intermedia]CAA6654614.1 unnamed protein product [Spirodela intermedia]